MPIKKSEQTDQGATGETPPQDAQDGATIIPPQADPPAPVVLDSAPISARAYVEETPRLTREAGDIITRIHLDERHTREEWTALAAQYGGHR